ncbi:Hoc head outer capsid protein [Aeromonas phage 65]|uniref:Capsid and scaffold protein n=2 Tax=Ishigurovirus osborne TaxID=260149 RepID=A0A219YC62_9CAUD|nr:Hoc-like head decoration [Aeromonas phage 65]ADQ53154.1 Hoc head outer capsid protein [Aeromonas phage 65]APU01532.1 capsid and scaffold protein [Aeromonas phage 65.2]
MILINGPDYALVGDNVSFVIDSMVLPVGGILVGIEWYKSGALMPQLPQESPNSFDLYDIDYPAAGVYYARLIYTKEGSTSYILSNEINFEVGVIPREIDISILSSVDIHVEEGANLTLTPSILVSRNRSTLSYNWIRNGNTISTENTLNKIVSDSDYGEYNYVVTATKLGAYIPKTETFNIRLFDEIEPESCRSYYIVPLHYRSAGFTWVGYWVTDEILKAKNEGFNWISDPTNPRFKYPCLVSLLAEGFETYPNFTVMESRNGRILGRADLT